MFFNASASTSRYGTIQSYSWNFGDNKVEVSTTPTISHTYSSSNNYGVVLTITDNHNAQATTSLTVPVIANVAPTADFSIFRILGYTVSVASVSTDGDGIITDYDWDWNDLSAHGKTQSLSHIYKTPGDYTISLIVTDDNNVVSNKKQITVHVPTNLPIASFTASVTKLSVFFNATASVSVLGTIKNYLWDFGDGHTQSALVPTTTHVYTTSGEKTVVLKVTDNQNLF